jgi:hypothetical protein
MRVDRLGTEPRGRIAGLLRGGSDNPHSGIFSTNLTAPPDGARRVGARDFCGINTGRYTNVFKESW